MITYSDLPKNVLLKNKKPVNTGFLFWITSRTHNFAFILYLAILTRFFIILNNNYSTFSWQVIIFLALTVIVNRLFFVGYNVLKANFNYNIKLTTCITVIISIFFLLFLEIKSPLYKMVSNLYIFKPVKDVIQTKTMDSELGKDEPKKITFIDKMKSMLVVEEKSEDLKEAATEVTFIMLPYGKCEDVSDPDNPKSLFEYRKIHKISLLHKQYVLRFSTPKLEVVKTIEVSSEPTEYIINLKEGE